MPVVWITWTYTKTFPCYSGRHMCCDVYQRKSSWLSSTSEPGATVSDSITGHMPACKPKTAKSYFSAELGKPAAFLPPPRLHRTGSHTRPFFEDSKLVASHLHVTDDALILGKMWWQGTIELDFTEPHLFNPKQKLPRTAWHVRNCHRQRKPVTAGSHNFQSNM